jgi:hypothetical protein
MKLNSAQARGLANFFFDIAKGALLAGLGFSVITPTSLFSKWLFLVNSAFITYFSVRFALELLEGVE